MRKVVRENNRRLVRSQNKNIYVHPNPQEKAKIELLELSKFSDDHQSNLLTEVNPSYQIKQLHLSCLPKTAKSENFSSLKNKVDLYVIRNKIQSNRQSLKYKKHILPKNISTSTHFQYPKRYYQTPCLNLYNEHIIDERQHFKPQEFYIFRKPIVKNKKEINPFLSSKIKNEGLKSGKNEKEKYAGRIKYKSKV